MQRTWGRERELSAEQLLRAFRVTISVFYKLKFTIQNTSQKEKKEKKKKMDLTPCISLITKTSFELETKEWFSGNSDAAVAFAEATEGTHTWYTNGKRSVHQPQLESLSSIVKHLIQKENDNGIKIDQLVELGAGKGLLGCILQKLTSIPLTSIERRDVSANYDHSNDVTRLTSDLTEVELSTLIDPKNNILALAKHFCGPASDAAIKTFIETPQVHMAVIAPCCHPQLTWETYSNSEYLESLGFTETDFPLLLDLLTLSKYTKGISEKDCKRWKDLKNLPRDTVYTLGRQVRRILEEGRCRQLQNNGFADVTVVKYAPDSVTPDNLIIVAKRKGMGLTQSIQERNYSILPNTGVVLHCNGDTSVTNRLTEYILELRSNPSISAILQSAAIHTIKYSNETLSNVIVIEGDPKCILLLLAYNPLVLRTVDIVIPFTSISQLGHESNEETCLKAIQQHVVEGSVYRICAIPRNIEQSLYTKMSCASPTTFTDTFFALVWRGRHEFEKRIMHSSIPRPDFDVRDWREAACKLPAWVKSKTDKSIHYFIVEVHNRYLKLVPESTVVIVYDDKKNPAVNTACTTLAKEYKMKTECIFKDEPTQNKLTPTTPVQLVLFILGMGSPSESIAKVLSTTSLPEGTPIAGQLKLGVQSRGRRALERALGPWKEKSAPFKDSWISHSVTDKETERTLISYYSPDKIKNNCC